MAPSDVPAVPSRLVVKHTFLSLSDDTSEEIWRPRASSDSALLGHEVKDKGRLADAYDCKAADFELRGLSDDETDSEGAVRRSSDACSTSSDDDAVSEEEPQLKQVSLSLLLNSDGETEHLKSMREQLESIASENARLTQENSLLRHHVSEEAEGSQRVETAKAAGAAHTMSMMPMAAAFQPQASQFFPGVMHDMDASMFRPAFQQSHSQVPHFSPVCQDMDASIQSQSGWWMPTQVACVAMPVMTSQPSCHQAALPPAEHQQPNSEVSEPPVGRRGRRKARAARAVVHELVGQKSLESDSVRSIPVALDAILPDPVKPLPEPQSGRPRTTVMLRNMPNNYSRTMLVDLLESEGFAGQYDFLYLPMDFQSRACLGYAFINFTTPQGAADFWRVFDGYSNWAIPSRKVSGVSWSGPHQGLEAHIDRYRSSPVMSEAVPDEYKPILLGRNGVRIPFPPPTRRIRAPRMR